MGYIDRILDRIRFARFVARLMEGIRRAGEPDELRYDREQQAILQVRDGEVVGVINPGNLYSTYRRLPRKERAGYIKHCVVMALTRHKELPEDFESASPDLRPRLWPRATIEHERLRGLVKGKTQSLADVPSLPVGEHLLTLLVYDWPESVQSVPADTLDAWGVSLYEAMEVARHNLDEATTMYARLGENLYCFTIGDSYDASRLALVDRIAGLEVRGEPVALVPSRGQLLVTGTEDELGLTMMLDLAAQSANEPYPLSPLPLVLRDGEWADWLPPDDHPLFDRIREVETNWLGTLYAEQKPLLEEVLKQRDDDRFVASYSGVKKQDDSVVSYCVWGEGVTYLLPATRKVVLIRTGAENASALGTWERVMEIAGDLLEPTDDYPRRYRTLGFPDEKMLRAIGLGEM